MKRFLAGATGLALAVSLLAGCSSNLPSGYSPFHAAVSSTEEQNSQAQPASPSATPSGGASLAGSGQLKTGMAVISSTASSKDAGEEDGLAQIDSTVVAVLVDDSGRIVSCKIDEVRSQINFSKEGKLVTPVSTLFQTKRELGDAYGMKAASSIGMEWKEQAQALANYITGKTLDEVKGIALTETTAPADAELSASTTISIGNFINAVEKAVNSAVACGAQPGDSLGLGISTAMSDSTDATAQQAGLAQASSVYAVATFDADGKVTSCLLDSSQSNVNFDSAGKITSDISAALQTKNELGDAYGMKAASGIGKEWMEQAAAYAQYAQGKTVAELSGIAINEHGAPADAELSASVTIGIGDFNSTLQKAYADAQQ